MLTVKRQGNRCLFFRRLQKLGGSSTYCLWDFSRLNNDAWVRSLPVATDP